MREHLSSQPRLLHVGRLEWCFLAARPGSAGTSGEGEVPSFQGNRSVGDAKALPWSCGSPWAVADTGALVWDVGGILELSFPLIPGLMNPLLVHLRLHLLE